MKTKCSYCGGTLIIDENNYKPGETISVECRRCGVSNDILIPLSNPEDSEKNIESVNTTISSDLTSETKESVLKDIKIENQEENISNEKEEEIPNLNKSKKKRPKPETPNNEKTHRSTKTKEKLVTSDMPSPSPVPKQRAKRKTTPAKKPVNAPVNTTPPGGSNNKGCSNAGCLVFILILGAALACFWGLRKCGGSDKEIVNDVDTDVEAVEVVAEVPELYDVADTVCIYGAIYDSVPIEEDPVLDEETDGSVSYKMGFHSGKNSFDGNMIHTDGRRFPFTLEFYYYPGENRIDNITYVNSSSGTRVKMETVEFTSSFVKFEGKDGGKAFILQFSDTQPYTGDAWWGNFHQDIELNYR